MLLLVLGIALIVRLALILQMGPHYYFGDTPSYDRAARSILAGAGPGADFPRAPFYPALMALGYALGGTGNLFAVRLLQLLLGMGVVALCYALGRRVAGPAAGLLAALAATFEPTLVFTTGMLYPSVLYTLLLLAATLATVRTARSRRAASAVGLGVLLGLCWLAEQVALVPGVALLGWLAAVDLRRGVRALAVPALALVVSLVVVAPWLVYHQRAYGTPAVFVGKARDVLRFARTDTALYGVRAVRDSADDASTRSAGGFFGRELRNLKAHPLGYLSDYTREFLHFFKPLPDRITSRNQYNRGWVKWMGGVYFLLVLLLAVPGWLLGRAPPRDRWLLALVTLSTAAIYAFFFTQTRYRVPVVPQMLVLAALGAARLLPRGTPSRSAGERTDP